jgi:NADH-quinone oxidoreductase subunit L
MNGALHLWLIPLLPFAGFVVNGTIGRKLPKALVTAVALLAPAASFAVVLAAVASNVSLPYVETCPVGWINAGTLHIDFSFVSIICRW